MAKVIIAFSRDMKDVGKTVDMEDGAAAALVNEGRARYADATPKAARRSSGTKPSPGTGTDK